MRKTVVTALVLALLFLLQTPVLAASGSLSADPVSGKVGEMRLLCLGGYMPNLLACYRCGSFESDPMFFDVQEGCIYCKDCYRNNALTAPLGVITALRYICLTEDVSRIFSFSLSEENIDILSAICEKYLLSRIDGRLTTLEFYKSLFH